MVCIGSNDAMHFNAYLALMTTPIQLLFT